MQEINVFFSQHWLGLLVGYFVYSAIVSGMPKPQDCGWGHGYLWVYDSAHALAGNVDKIFGKFLSRFFPPATEGK